MTDLGTIKKFLYENKKTFDVALMAGNDEAVVNNYILGICNTLVMNESLMKCSVDSIRDAAITSATLGVPIDGRKLAYLVPYKDKAQFQLSYKGYIHIAKRDTDVDRVESVLVYKDDQFSIDMGENKIVHIPNIDSETYGKNEAIKYTYARVIFKATSGRAQQFEVMTKAEIDKIRSTSSAGGEKDKWGNLTIWEKHYGEMARKTVIKRLMKHAQLGDVTYMETIDDANEDGRIINVTPEGIVQVEDLLFKDKEKIVSAILEAKTDGELQHIFDVNRDKYDEISCYNIEYAKEITKAAEKKTQEMYVDTMVETIEMCDNVVDLDRLYQANELKMKHNIKASARKEIIEAYTEKKTYLLDKEVA